MRKLSAAMICVGLFLGVLLMAPAPAHASPGVVTMDLYGSSTGGWGLLSSSESNPGPHISVHQGDTVTITLHSTDGFPHQFFVDYNRNDVIDADEPASGSFSTTTTVTFTATQLGTFDYFCLFHPTTMKGDFVVETSGSPGGTTTRGADNTLLIVGAVIAVVAAAGVGALVMMRRKK